MNRPTRGQWRGYAVLCIVLAAVLVAVIVWPTTHTAPQPCDHTVLQQTVEQYGDSLITATRRQKEEYRHRYGRPSYDTLQRRYYSNAARPKRERVTVELNGADTNMLQQLYGIGPAFARRIVKYRQLLGGYVRKEQLLEVYGMDEERYKEIEHYVTVDTAGISKIALPTATIEQLKRHPYLDYYQAREIVRYRDRGNRLAEPQDLLKVNLMDEKTIEKIANYIIF